MYYNRFVYYFKLGYLCFELAVTVLYIQLHGHVDLEDDSKLN